MKKNMKKIILIFGILLLNIFLVSANGDHQSEFEEGKKLVESEIGCDKLSDEQLEEIGEYYMKQMHPGESHDLMHKMMGMEERTKYHKQFHVNIAKMVYCSEGGMMMGGNMMSSGGMMGMMNMMGGNMMSGQTPQTNMMQGMMENWGYFGYWNFLNVLYVILLIGLIILVYLWIMKLSRNMKNKGNKK